MINGLDTFSEYFKPYIDQYVIIGGLACDLLMTEAGLDFRRTKDIDMVLILEAKSTEFAKAFWDFVAEGKYSAKEKSTGEHKFYRFSNPLNIAFPKMIELFSRRPKTFIFSNDNNLTPIHYDDSVSSLSAILLDDDYYNFILNGRIIVNMIPTLDAAHLIPLKMKAFLDLSARKENGEHIDSKNIKKHKLDVFRLFPLLSEEEKIPVPPSIYSDISSFIRQMENAEIPLNELGISKSKESALKSLREIYIMV